MPKPDPTNISINLLPEDEFLIGGIGKIIRWAVSVGRYLVIFTEVIVIISFATRFGLDRRVTDLNQEISKKIAIIQSYASFETEFRSAQDRLKQYSELEKQRNLTSVFEQLSNVTPPDVTVTQLQVTQTSISITGSTASQTAFNHLINNLQLSSAFTDVRIDRVENTEDSSGYEFTLQVKATDAN